MAPVFEVNYDNGVRVDLNGREHRPYELQLLTRHVLVCDMENPLISVPITKERFIGGGLTIEEISENLRYRAGGFA